jgi:two-component system, NtrC family, sensor kinase
VIGSAPNLDLVAYLRHVSLFANAGDNILQHLAAITSVSTYQANQTVIEKGDQGDAMYVIVSGRLKVHDHEHQVAELKKGEFFGELSLLDSEPRSMSVTTLEESVLGSISRNDFYEVLKQFPEMTKDIIAALNHRLRTQNDVLIREYKGREEHLKELVRQRTLQLEAKNQELQQALESLKLSQEQLVQSEKLASLGQLIAGIAHEIQNPLNFVNNFSQLSQDLIHEAIETGDEEERKELLGDLGKNLEKINHHGKRADSIVKNMLEHSRTGTGQKQPTNLNQLCREYMQLTYQGVRSNNQRFNCEIETEYAENLPLVNIVPQDISRVLLNLFNNAFYALSDKQKSINNHYQPLLKVKTELQGNEVQLRIADNGKGIPASVKDKIFEPFFTTKPTGQGTGLGLSLSFDIIKAHGGRISFDSREGEGTTFLVALPVD